jgi:hypothetical protein
VLAPPVGGRGFRRYLPLATLVLGTAIGGLLLGGVLVVISYALLGLDELRVATLLALGAIAAVTVLWPRGRALLPERTCQVSTRYMLSPPTQAALRWGIDLGTGVSTFLVTPAVYAFVGIVLAQADAVAILALCCLYGVGRGGAIATFAIAGAPRRASTRSLPGVGLEPRLRVPLVVAILAAIAAFIAT